MIRVWAILVFGFIATAAAADPIVVRSGEHDGFTRLVMAVPAGTRWTLERAGRRAELTLALTDARFDTGQVFDRIPRTRLRDLDRTGAGLVLHLGCECRVTGFEHDKRFLVIDILDSETDLALPPPLPAVPRHAYRFPTGPAQTQDGSVARPPAGGAVGLPQTDGPLALAPSNTAAVNASQRRLLEQIGRATQQGLLDLREPDRAPPQPATAASGAAGGALPGDIAAPAPDRPASNVAVLTAADRDMGALRSHPAAQSAASSCLPPEVTDLAAWSDGRPFAAQISGLRATLYSEFDRVQAATAVTLARAYLHFGFGAEARAVLALVPDAPPGHAALVALSRVVDGEADDGDIFAGQQGCDGDVAMWSALATPIDAAHVNADAVQRALARLPAHLRGQLGPRLAERFTSAGDWRTAKAILRTAARSGDAASADLVLAEAGVATARHQDDIAAGKLREVAETGSHRAPQALIALVESHWTTRTAIAPDLPDLVAAHALERRRTELGPDLRRAHAVALALAGRFDDAFAALDDVSRHDGPASLTRTLVPVLTLLGERADDVTFLRYALPRLSDLPAGRDGPAQSIARRFLDLGFAAQARTALAASAGGPATPERSILLARTALAQDRPHRALVTLMDLDGAEAERLRAAALFRVGEHRNAAEASMRAQDVDGAARGYWLADAAAEVSPLGDTPYLPVAAATGRLTPSADPDLPAGPLAHAGALLEQSRSARADVNALLAAVAIDDTAR